MKEAEHLVRPYEHCPRHGVHMLRSDDTDRWCDLLQVTPAKLTYTLDTIGRDAGTVRTCGSVCLLRNA